MFYTVIDMCLQELNNKLIEINIEVLICVSYLNLKTSFSSFSKDMLLQLVHLYLSDFNQFVLPIFVSQFENYIMDVQDDRIFLEQIGWLNFLKNWWK
jgi:hypothetical protein